MLFKLLKYDLRSMWKQLSLVWGAALVLALVNRLTHSLGFMFRARDFENHIAAITAFALMAVFVTMFIISVVFVLQRFYRGLLGGEGYLMHTLPVRAWELVASKMICAIVTYIGSGIVAVLSILLMITTDWWEFFFNFPLWTDILRGIIAHPDIIPFAESLGVDSVAIMDLTAQKLMGNEWDEIGRYPRTARYYLEKVQEAAANSKVQLVSIPQHVFCGEPKGSMEEEQAQMAKRPMFPDAQMQRRLRESYQKLHMVKPLIPASKGNGGLPGKTGCQGICNNFAETPFLSPTGELFACCIDGVHVYGNLKEAESFEEIWNGEAYRSVRRNFYQGKLPKYCNACSFLKGDAMSRLKLTSIDETFYENEFSKLLYGLAENIKR